MDQFKDRDLDAELVNYGMAAAPFSNTYTAEVMALTGTPEFRKSLFTEVVWRLFARWWIPEWPHIQIGDLWNPRLSSLYLKIN